jgi:hypothetical protein
MTHVYPGSDPRWLMVGEPGSRPEGIPATVASLVIRVRLVPLTADHERTLARLMATCEALQSNCERLVRQVQDLLAEEAPAGRVRRRSSLPSRR